MDERLADPKASSSSFSGSGHPETDLNESSVSSTSVETALKMGERGNHCFGCGADNPQGLHLEFNVREEAGVIKATSLVTMTRVHEGPPGHIHGGLIATLLDEAMSKLNRPLNLIAMTRSLSVDYLRPSPLFVPLRLVAKHEKRIGRKVLHSAELQAMDGTVLAKAEGFFVVVDPLLLAKK